MTTIGNDVTVSNVMEVSHVPVIDIIDSEAYRAVGNIWNDIATFEISNGNNLMMDIDITIERLYYNPDRDINFSESQQHIQIVDEDDNVMATNTTNTSNTYSVNWVYQVALPIVITTQILSTSESKIYTIQVKIIDTTVSPMQHIYNPNNPVVFDPSVITITENDQYNILIGSAKLNKLMTNSIQVKNVSNVYYDLNTAIDGKTNETYVDDEIDALKSTVTTANDTLAKIETNINTKLDIDSASTADVSLFDSLNTGGSLSLGIESDYNYIKFTKPSSRDITIKSDNIQLLGRLQSKSVCGVYILDGSKSDFTLFPIYYSTTNLNKINSQENSGVAISVAESTSYPSSNTDITGPIGTFDEMNCVNSDDYYLVLPGYGVVVYDVITYGTPVKLAYANHTASPQVVKTITSNTASSVKIYFDNVEITV